MWGNSLAGQLDVGFGHAFATKGETGVEFSRPSCPPLPGLSVSTNLFNAHRDCEKHNAQVLAFLLASPSIKTVFLAARWAAYADGRRFGRESGGRYYLVDADHRAPSIATSRLCARSPDRRRANAAGGGQAVVVVEQTPEMGFDAGRCFRLLDPVAAAERCVVPRAAVVDRRSAADAAIAAARKRFRNCASSIIAGAVRRDAVLRRARRKLPSTAISIIFSAGADRLVPDLLREAQID